MTEKSAIALHEPWILIHLSLQGSGVNLRKQLKSIKVFLLYDLKFYFYKLSIAL